MMRLWMVVGAILALVGSAVGQLREIDFSGFRWQLRDGMIGGVKWNRAGVYKYANGKRLLIQIPPGTMDAAGIQMKNHLPFGTYTVQITARTAAMNPNMVCAVWLRDVRAERPFNSETTVEFSPWGDQMNYLTTMLTVFDKTDELKAEVRVRAPMRFAEKHRIVLGHYPFRSKIDVYGWWESNKIWKQYAALDQPRTNVEGPTLRMAMWPHTGKLLAGTARGETRMWVEWPVSFVPGLSPP